MPRSFRSAAFAILCLAGIAPSLPGEEGFVPLFNGKDFSGWVNVNCAPSTWSFDDEGLLVCSGKPIGEIRTERMYQNFILELEWRHLVPKGNAGVFVWADDITARGQPFIRGVEIQILEVNRQAASLRAEATRSITVAEDISVSERERSS